MKKQPPDFENVQEELLEILRAVKKVQYGSVEITIHGAKIVQIETREKVRFDQVKTRTGLR